MSRNEVLDPWTVGSDLREPGNPHHALHRLDFSVLSHQSTHSLTPTFLLSLQVLFKDREFAVGKGIVCSAAGASDKTKQALLDVVAAS